LPKSLIMVNRSACCRHHGSVSS